MSTDGTTSTLNDNIVVNGTSTTNGDETTNGNEYTNGNSVVTGKVNQSSDIRFKKNVNTINNALDKVLKLRGVTYEWKTDEFPEKHFAAGTTYGVIAQEVEKIIPELVSTNETDGYKSVAYSNMVSLFIEAIKEQQQQIEAQQQQINELKYLLSQIRNCTSNL